MELLMVVCQPTLLLRNSQHSVLLIIQSIVTTLLNKLGVIISLASTADKISAALIICCGLKSYQNLVLYLARSNSVSAHITLLYKLICSYGHLRRRGERCWGRRRRRRRPQVHWSVRRRLDGRRERAERRTTKLLQSFCVQICHPDAFVKILIVVLTLNFKWFQWRNVMVVEKKQDISFCLAGKWKSFWIEPLSF